MVNDGYPRLIETTTGLQPRFILASLEFAAIEFEQLNQCCANAFGILSRLGTPQAISLSFARW
jgi:hypothetical protein